MWETELILPVLPQERSILQRACWKVLHIKFPCDQSTGWWLWYALEDMNLDSFQK